MQVGCSKCKIAMVQNADIEKAEIRVLLCPPLLLRMQLGSFSNLKTYSGSVAWTNK